MAGISNLVNVWKNLKEVDLRPFRKAAITPVKLAIVGHPGVGRHTLADQMRHDPQRSESPTQTQTAVLISDLTSEDWVNEAELIILVLDVTSTDFSLEKGLSKKWIAVGKKVLALVNEINLPVNLSIISNPIVWEIEHVLHGSVFDPIFLQREFVPAILELLPERQLALGRQFPLFRVAVANQLIKDSCFSNAVYSFSTGVAEVIPFFDIPLNMTDLVVLTKAQGFLVYKLGLALGFSTRWQDYAGEFGSVVGGGFVWRQLARMLIGLIPIWGIVPKVAVAYSGTFIIGHVFLQWYLTGRHITREQMRAIYSQALINGKNFAQNTISLLKRPHSDRGKKALLPLSNLKSCLSCAKLNAPDALFCQYCGQTLQPNPT